ncbi:mannitol-1-phosphate dehydrogenase [Gymnopilus junonius]|uniref:alcohol dehydrogenase n=1 Tax=Gymnopilus junonius TaxID=109634 RepID=A0A9P5TLK7_GYMJU|nr:mannitol-1-phosphate dehydrogenase [Gymnopilus junonius]
MSAVPTIQKAAVVGTLGQDVLIKDFPVKSPQELAPGECLLKMICTGVCHTDLHAAMGDWPIKPKTPLIGGHEGVGEVVAIGKDTVDSPVKVGQRVGVKWIANSCRNCEHCRKGLEQNCEDVLLSGYTVNGTFSQYVVSWVHIVTAIPDELGSEAAASILCAGLTVYRALKNSQTNASDWVVIPGAGGGLGHLAVQYAKYIGRRVIAIDTGDEKQKLTKELGADHWIDFRQTKDLVAEVKRLTGGKGAHAALVTTAMPSGYTQAVDYLRPGGHLMAVGLPAEAQFNAVIFDVVFKSITIHGSYVGNRQDAEEAIEIAASGAVKCHYVTKKLSDIAEVYDSLSKGTIAGRIILTMDV